MNSKATNVINSPMAHLAKVYTAVEAHLRKAAADKVPMTVTQLYNKDDVKSDAKNELQIRNILDTLARNKHVIRSEGKPVTFMWDLAAPPFVFQVRKARGSALKQPSKPKVVTLPKVYPEGKSYQYYQDEMHKLTEEFKKTVRERARKEGPSMEIEFEGALITLSRDPETGRVRVKVKDILS